MGSLGSLNTTDPMVVTCGAKRKQSSKEVPGERDETHNQAQNYTAFRLPDAPKLAPVCAALVYNIEIQHMPEIATQTWNRFITRNLSVAADVMGSVHEFDFETFHVKVRLPKQEDAQRDEGFDEVARLTSWKASTKEPLVYDVAKVDVNVLHTGLINVPEEALSNPPNQYEHFTDRQKNTVEDMCNRFSGIAERAFQYWVEILRWVSSNAMIGQPDISGFESGWSTYLMDVSTGHRVWGSSHTIVVHLQSEITKEYWKKAEEHLNNGDTLPLHLRFFHDAKASKRNGQYEKAIIELAMACEIYLRYQVFEFIPESTPQELKKYIEEANINKYVSQFFNSLVPESKRSAYKKIAKDISSLMSRRNSYVHMGELHDADERLCCRFIDTTEELFKICLRSEKDEN
jgi:hypothetical protein